MHMHRRSICEMTSNELVANNDDNVIHFPLQTNYNRLVVVEIEELKVRIKFWWTF